MARDVLNFNFAPRPEVVDRTDATAPVPSLWTSSSPDPAPKIEDVDALIRLDRSSPAGEWEDGLMGPAELNDQGGGRRLRAPPVRVSSASMGRESLRSAVGAFAARKHRPVMAPPSAVEAEARMIAVVAGILRLQGDIGGRRRRGESER